MCQKLPVALVLVRVDQADQGPTPAAHVPNLGKLRDMPQPCQ